MNLKDKLEHKIFHVISDVAAETGTSTFVIGGYVRDLLLKRPSKDIDFVVLGNGLEIAGLVAEKLEVKKVAYYKNFGTAAFVYDGLDIEFVGARKESYNRNSRKPIVENGTLQDDQNRRDFTINALAISLNKSSFGEVLDPFNGIAHLQERLLKTPLDPDQTYSDDPLRMMRAIRFATQLNFKIEEESFTAITKNAKRLEIVSIERIMTEFNKIVLADKPSIGIKLLFNTQLLHQFFPEMVALQGVDKIDGKSHKDNFYHTLEVLDNISEATDDLWLRWAAILHDIAKHKTKRFHKDAGWPLHDQEEQGDRKAHRIFNRLKHTLDNTVTYIKKIARNQFRKRSIEKSSVQ
ncbi:MAG: HD domain-containing protein [Crocinitomicaceae bacterium]|nr:HD domain-containing protein [Crocinitomicaceae bacterium]